MEARIRPGPVRGEILVPGSKSVAQRAIVLATRDGGIVRNVPWNDDLQRLAEGLRALGYFVGHRMGEVEVSGTFHQDDAEIDAGDSGTGARFLLALAALRSARTLVDGSARLRARPVAPLCAALRELGCEVEGDAFPVAVRGPMQAGSIRLSTDVSSQFASALILVVDRVKGLKVSVQGRHSFSYITLTAYVLRTFRSPYEVEPDFSSASALAAAAATSGGDLLLRGLSLSSPQPDARIVPFLNRAGAKVSTEDDGFRVRGGPLRGVRADVANCPDLAPLLGALGALAEGETRVLGAPHLVHKESDRIEATVAMIRTLGGEVEPLEDGFVVRGGRPLHGGTIDARGDHRIAMAAAVLALSVPGVTVAGAEAVSKSYPAFFQELEGLIDGAQ